MAQSAHSTPNSSANTIRSQWCKQRRERARDALSHGVCGHRCEPAVLPSWVAEDDRRRLKKKLAWLPFAGKNRGWENFSVPASRVFCAVRRLATRPQGQVLARAQKDAALPAHRLAVQATAAEPEQARRLSLVRLACGGGACALWMGQAHYKTPRLGPRLGPRFGFGPSLGEALVAKALAQGFTKASPGHPLVMPRWPW